MPGRRRRVPGVVTRLAAAAALLVVVGGIVTQVSGPGGEGLVASATADQRGADALEKRVAHAARVRSTTVSSQAAVRSATTPTVQFPEQLSEELPEHLASVRQP
jgi:hypothetical protein